MSPLQSKTIPGVSPPQMYGVPTWASAQSSAIPPAVPAATVWVSP